MLSLSKIKKRYGATVALDAVDLEISNGRTTVLIGPSGCGKSTLLRVLIGLIAPDAGVAWFCGRPHSTTDINAMRHQMGYVIQDGGLFPHLTAQQNVNLLAEHLGWARARIDARVRELAELTHFPRDGLARYPQQLSGGQRQRVSLMRALMLDPDVLLLDEPLGALDPMVRRRLQIELREIFQRLEKTVVMVTHDLCEAAFFADEIVLMRAGRIVQRGTLDDLTQRPAEPFVAEFVEAQFHSVSDRAVSDQSRDRQGADTPSAEDTSA
jgi:osmoprotectant transport system ATP-binding protein